MCSCTWGSLDASDGAPPHYFVVVRGHLASEDATTNQATHDAVADGGEPAAIAIGDAGHVVFTGLEDPREFLAIDVWSSSANTETLDTNPDFQAAFATLFDAPPSVQVFASSEWYGW